LGTLDVPHEHLGDAIQQYGQFLASTDGYGKRLFTFNKPNKSTVPKVNFHDISFWILAAGEGSSAKTYAQAWDSAILFHNAYRKSLAIDDWNKFVKAAAIAQRKK
jgi:hypothetical protein